MLIKKKMSEEELPKKRKKYWKKHKMHPKLTVKSKAEKNFFKQSYGSYDDFGSKKVK